MKWQKSSQQEKYSEPTEMIKGVHPRFIHHKLRIGKKGRLQLQNFQFASVNVRTAKL